MSYITDQEELSQKVEKVNFMQENMAGLRAVFAAFPTVCNNEANAKMLEAYCSPGPVNFDAVVWGLQPGNGNLINELAIQTEDEAREKFISEIVNATKGDATAKKFLRESLSKTFHVDIAGTVFEGPTHTTRQLQTRAENEAERRELAQKSPQELRGIVKQYVADNRAKLGPPPLGPEHTPTSLKKMSASELRKLMRVHGADKVSQRLVGRG